METIILIVMAFSLIVLVACMGFFIYIIRMFTGVGSGKNIANEQEFVDLKNAPIQDAERYLDDITDGRFTKTNEMSYTPRDPLLYQKDPILSDDFGFVETDKSELPVM